MRNHASTAGLAVLFALGLWVFAGATPTGAFALTSLATTRRQRKPLSSASR